MNRWYFWVLAPIMLATGLGLPLIVHPPNPSGVVILYTLCGALVVGVIGLAQPHRFQWALRAVAGVILLSYVAYVIVEAIAWWHGKPFGVFSSESDSNLRNALLGLITFGAPSLYFLISGRSGTKLDRFLQVEDEGISR